MFQYAAGLNLAVRRRTVLKLDVSWYKYREDRDAINRYGLSCFNITEQFATQQESRTIAISPPPDRLSAPTSEPSGEALYSYRENGYGYDKEFYAQPDNAYISGAFQSEQYFGDIAGLLRLHFTSRYPASDEVLRIADAVIKCNSVAVHFRRGDYVTNEKFRHQLGALSLDYYYRACNMLRQSVTNPTLFIFSDDIEWVERNFHPDIPHVYVRATGIHDFHEKIRLMSLCRHIIIANSTFSWWAAWLTDRPEKIVIAPDPWFADPSWKATDLVPVRWKRAAR